MSQNVQRTAYLDYWRLSKESKEKLIRRLTAELPGLRAAVKATQDEIANAIGVSRQTYNAIESNKRTMTWNTYLSLILFFDYNPYSHHRIRQLGAFPELLDECWLAGKVIQTEGVL